MPNVNGGEWILYSCMRNQLPQFFLLDDELLISSVHCYDRESYKVFPQSL